MTVKELMRSLRRVLPDNKVLISINKYGEKSYDPTEITDISSITGRTTLIGVREMQKSNSPRTPMKLIEFKCPKVVGELLLGPKEKYLFSFPICYVPTSEQIRNIKEMFGWDIILYENDEDH